MLRILLVEDDKFIVALTSKLLQAPPGEYDVVEVSTVADATRALETQGRFDAMLLDLRLGSEDGSVLMEIAAACDPRVTVVIHSGINDEATIWNLYNRGAEDFIVKGSIGTPLDFQNRIAGAVGRKEALRAAAEKLGSLGVAIEGADAPYE